LTSVSFKTTALAFVHHTSADAAQSSATTNASFFMFSNMLDMSFCSCSHNRILLQKKYMHIFTKKIAPEGATSLLGIYLLSYLGTANAIISGIMRGLLILAL
jgi:hypothetical protein